MNKKVGIWIDHRAAVVVTIEGETEHTERIASGVDKHGRFSGHAAETDGVADDQRDRKFAAHLGKYYDDVMSHLHGAESIFVFGPGEAKGEFEKHLVAKGLGKLIAGVETADKMTDPQIVAKVRLHYRQHARGLV